MMIHQVIHMNLEKPSRFESDMTGKIIDGTVRNSVVSDSLTQWIWFKTSRLSLDLFCESFWLSQLKRITSVESFFCVNWRNPILMHANTSSTFRYHVVRFWITVAHCFFVAFVNILVAVWSAARQNMTIEKHSIRQLWTFSLPELFSAILLRSGNNYLICFPTSGTLLSA